MSINSDLRMSADIRRLPWMRRLAVDYIYHFAAVSSFFAGDPTDPHAWRSAISRAGTHPRPRAELVHAIHAQQQRRGAPLPALESTRTLGRDDSVAVVTGQQAGLFGGPLFTLLKALTAIRLAERVSVEFRVPAVPVFWVDAEDHDWNEVRACTIFDETMSTYTVSLPADESARNQAIGARTLDASIGITVRDLEAHLAPTEFRAALLGDLEECYRPDRTMADGFARWLEHVVGTQGLVVYDASDRACKPLASDVFVRELSQPGETGRLADRAGTELVSRGYHAQVSLSEDSVALFHLGNERLAIRHHDDAFVIGERRVPASVLVEQARGEAAAFSPNVLLRPIVQDTLFPTACYVAGPNELAYLGQLRGVYEHFGVPMPLIHPRATATLVDSAALRFLTKYNVVLESMWPQDDKNLNELLANEIPAAVEGSFVKASQAVEAEMTRLIREIPALDPTLEGAARSTLGKMQHDLQTLRGKMIHAAKRRDETLRRQYSRTRHLVFPNGHAQEREIGFISFLNQYGPALVQGLLGNLPLDSGRHWIVSI